MNDLLKELRIAKLQIMWSISVATLALYAIIRHPIEGLLELLFIPLYIAVWYLGAVSLRRSIEKETEEE